MTMYLRTLHPYHEYRSLEATQRNPGYTLDRLDVNRRDAECAELSLVVRRSGFSREMSMFAAKAAPTYNRNTLCVFAA